MFVVFAVANISVQSTLRADTEKDSAAKDKKANLYAQIEAAVKAGKLTKEDAAAKLSALKQSATTKDKKDSAVKYEKSADYDSIASKLAELVKKGIISDEQADAMIAAARKVGNAKQTD
jgi:polyhydroxyalkanoate synthesis regulator phasin